MNIKSARKSISFSSIIKQRCLVYLALFIVVCAPPATFSQTDTEYWFVAPEISKNGAQNFDVPIYLRISSYDVASVVTISQPANPAFLPIIVNVPANGFSTVDLSPFLDMIENKPANSILNYGIHIEATTPVSVYYEVASTYCNCNPELFALKGKNAVGTDFIIPTQNHFMNSASYNPTPYNAFDIVSTKENTVVTITPSHNILGHAAGVPFDVTLNKGQTWSALATSQEAANHLWGSVVTSTNPIAITMTDDLLWGITGCADLIGDQIVPVPITGTDYIAIRGNLTNNGNRAFIVATQDNTEVFIDGNAAPSATLATGQLFNHNILNPSTLITATHPVYVFQTSGFGCELGGALLPSINCTGSSQIAFTRTTSQQLGVVITTQSVNTGSFLVNGDPALITSSDFSVVPGAGGIWQAASKTFSLAQVPVGSVVFVTNTTGNFQLGLLIGDVGGGCSYGYFSDFSRLNLGPDISLCPGDSVNLHAGNGWSTYLWSTGETTEVIKVKNPGPYSVTVTDPACTLTDNLIVSMFPAPAADIGADHTLCNGLTETLSTTGGPFATYLWSTGATTPTLLITTSGTYHLTVTDFNGCRASDTVNILPGTGPLLTNSPLFKTICSGSSTNLPLTSNPPTMDFSWVATSSSPLVTGFMDGSNDIIDQILLSTSPDPETVTYVITPTLNGCAGAATNYIVTVNPRLPVGISIAASQNPVCAGVSVDLLATSANEGAAPGYQWKVNNVDAGTNSPSFTYTPANNDIVTCILTSSEACVSGNPASALPVTMNTKEVPVVQWPRCFDTITTINAKPIKLKGGLPLGGIYSGPGVNSVTEFFTPSEAGEGTITITYSYTNNQLCSSGKSRSIRVLASPVFTCGNSLTDIRDNKVYPTVLIGSQCWLASNLDYGSELTDNIHQTDNCIAEKYSRNSGSGTRNSYYQWDELMSYDDTPAMQGLCPPGWHVPTEPEWNTLFNYYQGNSQAAYYLKDQYIDGFKALPVGVYYLNSLWSFTDFATIFWSSTPVDQTRATAHGMNIYNFSVSLYPASRANAFTVRCLKD